MSVFTNHTPETAPNGASEVLAQVKERYGFIPNLAGYLAESPTTLEALLAMANAYDGSSLTPQEQQVVQLTVSLLNGCSYCKTAHTALSRKSEISSDDLKALLAFEPMPNKRLGEIRDFVRLLHERRGHVTENETLSFIDSGFTRAQVFEIVLGLAIKTLTNYANHLAGATPNPEFIAMVEAVEA